MGIKVILADDHEIVRHGLRTLLDKESDIEVVAEASNGGRAVELAQKHSPDVVIMDITMPDLNGIEAARQIRANNPKVKILALSMHSDKRFVVEMFKAGAAGYLLKDCAFEELIRAIREVAKNRRYLSPSGVAEVVLDCCLKQEAESPPLQTAFSLLSAREREILQLMSEGWQTKKIASRLRLSIKTVESHRRQIMNKLDIHNAAELVKYAIREGITSLDS